MPLPSAPALTQAGQILLSSDVNTYVNNIIALRDKDQYFSTFTADFSSSSVAYTDTNIIMSNCSVSSGLHCVGNTAVLQLTAGASADVYYRIVIGGTVYNQFLVVYRLTTSNPLVSLNMCAPVSLSTGTYQVKTQMLVTGGATVRVSSASQISSTLWLYRI